MPRYVDICLATTCYGIRIRFCAVFPLYTLVISLAFQLETFFATLHTLQRGNTFSRPGRGSRKKLRKFENGTLVADTTTFGSSTFSSFSELYLFEISPTLRPFTGYISKSSIISPTCAATSGNGARTGGFSKMDTVCGKGWDWQVRGPV